MFKRKLTQADYFLIGANLVPVVGAWFFGWDPKEIFIVYCLETVIIGFYTLVKMGIVTASKKKDMWYVDKRSFPVSGIFFMLFFIVHYGMFVAIQTGMFIQVSGIGKEYHLGFFGFFLHWPQYISRDSAIMLAVFFVSYGFRMLWNFIRNKEYQTAPLMMLMFSPYLRIIIQQFTVIIGSLFLAFGAGKVFILIFAFVKIFFEVKLNYDALMGQAMKEMKEQSGTQ